jgi:hypothetical protein
LQIGMWLANMQRSVPKISIALRIYRTPNSVIVEAFAQRCSSLDGLITQHTRAYAQA